MVKVGTERDSSEGAISKDKEKDQLENAREVSMAKREQTQQTLQQTRMDSRLQKKVCKTSADSAQAPRFKERRS